MADKVEKHGTEHYEGPSDGELAHLANQKEHTLGKLQCVKQYPLSCFWAVYAVWCIMLCSFENQAAGNIIGIPEFRKDFGSPYNGDYVLAAKWQSAFQGAPVAS